MFFRFSFGGGGSSSSEVQLLQPPGDFTPVATSSFVLPLLLWLAQSLRAALGPNVDHRPLELFRSGGEREHCQGCFRGPLCVA